MNNTLKTGLISTFLIASLSGCTDPNDVLLELDANFSANCQSYAAETEFTFNTSTDTKYKIDQITSYWSQMAQGQTMTADLKNHDQAICVNAANQNISFNKKANSWIIGKNISAAEAARKIMWDDTKQDYNNQIKWSERFVLDDALLYARLISAHKINMEIAQAYHMSGYSFQSPIWKDIEYGSHISRYAQIFKKTVEEYNNTNYGYQDVLTQALKDAQNHTGYDQQFLNWYDKYLHEQTVPVPSLCLSFDGDLDPCISWETQPPAKTTSAYELSAETLVKLTSSWMPSAYMDTETAQSLLNNENFRTIKPELSALYKTVEKNAAACCSTDARESSSSFLGLGTRGFGISIF
ncbi:MAG: hypothetical protein NZ828_05590 [Alphaproteobacteria bacterium]|nr:hypothetical protein [Alphaproteobacteria bacterium]